MHNILGRGGVLAIIFLAAAALVRQNGWPDLDAAPAPKAKPPKPRPINLVGTWHSQWGSWGGQQMTFRADGSCEHAYQHGAIFTGHWQLKDGTLHVQEIQTGGDAWKNWSVKVVPLYPALPGWGGQATGDYGTITWAIAPVRAKVEVAD